MSYTPPFTITSKILDIVSQISEIVGKLEVLAPTAISPTLRKANKIKTITRTLEIEGNTLGIEKVTAILEGKRVMGSMREIAEVNGAIKESQQEYYDALQSAGGAGESTPFVEFMLEAILETCERELKNHQDVPINRQDKILEIIQNDSSVTIEQLAHTCGVSDKTIKRDIAKLKENGLLEREGSLKSGHWKIIGEKA